MSGLLDRNALLAKNKKRRYQELELPTGGMVRIQSLTEAEQSQYETDMLSGGEPKNVRGKRKDGDNRLQLSKKALLVARLKLIVKCLVDAEGVRLFKDEEYTALEEMDAADTKVIFDACDAMLKSDNDYFEEILGNSERVHAVDSQ